MSELCIKQEKDADSNSNLYINLYSNLYKNLYFTDYKIVNNNLPLVQHNDYNKKEKSNVIIIGDPVLNNINSRELSSSNKVSVSNFPGATSEYILDEIDDTLKAHPDSLIVHAGTSDLTKNINTLGSVKKLCKKAKRISSDTKIVFSNIIYQKDRRNTDKQRIDTNARLRNFCNQKTFP